MEIAKVTSKGQMTLPKRIRERLHIHAGDVVALDIEDDTVVLRKLAPAADGYLKGVEGTLSEWNSPEEDEAWRDL